MKIKRVLNEYIKEKMLIDNSTRRLDEAAIIIAGLAITAIGLVGIYYASKIAKKKPKNKKKLLAKLDNKIKNDLKLDKQQQKEFIDGMKRFDKLDADEMLAVEAEIEKNKEVQKQKSVILNAWKNIDWEEYSVGDHILDEETFNKYNEFMEINPDSDIDEFMNRSSEEKNLRAITGIPEDDADYWDWEKQFVEGDETAISHLSDFFTASQMGNDDLLSSETWSDLDDKARNLKAFKSLIDKGGNDKAVKVMSALYGAARRGAFETKERLNKSRDSLLDLVEEDDVELLEKCLDTIESKLD